MRVVIWSVGLVGQVRLVGQVGKLSLPDQPNPPYLP
jgi:hypothetical protein